MHRVARRYGNVIAMILMLTVMLALAAAPLARSAPAFDVGPTLTRMHLPPAAVSYVVLAADDGRTVLASNAEVPRSPASTMKTITTFASLDLLGPAYTWHTRALAHGRLEDGLLDGDLVLQGGGDPYMTLERWWNFARRLRDQGLRRIRGDIIVDDSYFSPPAEDPAAFDGRPDRPYNAPPAALTVNFQSVEFSIAPDPKSRTVNLTLEPAPANLTIDNRIRFMDGRCRAGANRIELQIAAPRHDRVTFSGALAAHCAPRELTRVLLSPADYAFGTFVSLWRELGGEIDGRLRVEPAPPDARLLLGFDSLTLGEIVRLTNKFSNNLMARHLLLTLGAERYGAPGTVAKGVAAVGEWGRARGLDLTDLELDNGAGLSRTARISAATMATVLRAAYHSPYAPEFAASLPLAGLDGTLRTRMKTSPAGAVRLKTGHIDGVSGVAGYVTAHSGRTYVLVCLINDPRVDGGAGEAVHAALVQWIVDEL